MQKPEESLDDFLRTAELKVTPPPHRVSLRPTGEVEIVKPLALGAQPAKRSAVTDGISVSPAWPRFTWFHRSLVFGGGLALIAVIFLSAIFTAISDRSAEIAIGSAGTSGYAGDAPVDDILISEEGPASSDIFNTAPKPPAIRKRRTFRSVAKRKRTRLRIERIAYRPRLRAPKPQPVVSDFVPTTLIIYPENGEIKCRIEPQLIAVNKKTSTFDYPFRRPAAR